MTSLAKRSRLTTANLAFLGFSLVAWSVYSLDPTAVVRGTYDGGLLLALWVTGGVLVGGVDAMAAAGSLSRVVARE